MSLFAPSTKSSFAGVAAMGLAQPAMIAPQSNQNTPLYILELRYLTELSCVCYPHVATAEASDAHFGG
jgi:hypothetical protein